LRLDVFTWNEIEFAREISVGAAIKGKKVAEGGAATDGRGWRHVIKSLGAVSGSRRPPRPRRRVGVAIRWKTKRTAAERNGAE